jgi:hypothetical protein
MKYLIKNPTIRKVVNRGFTPVTYHSPEGFVSGWIYERGTKWLRFYSPSAGKLKLPLDAERHMTKHR